MNSQSWPACYKYWPNLSTATNAGVVRPIRWSDREDIRVWRNQQIEVLRQQVPISMEQQDLYYSQILAPQMSMTHPTQFLFGIEVENRLVGYGGLTNVNWGTQEAELSFLVHPRILKTTSYAEIMLAFITVVADFAKNQFGLLRIFTETYTQRTDHIEILKIAGFTQEEVLIDRVVVDGKPIDSLIHGLSLV